METPELHVPRVHEKSQAPVTSQLKSNASAVPSPEMAAEPSSPVADPSAPADVDSVTEEEEDVPQPIPVSVVKGKDRGTTSLIPPKRDSSGQPRNMSPDTSDDPPRPPTRSTKLPSDDSSSPIRPTKKTKRASSSSSNDDDSEAERRRRIKQVTGGIQRGAKQPMKRGGRRF